MDDYPHARVVNAFPIELAEAPVAAPTYVRLHEDRDVLVIGAPSFAVATCELLSGAQVLTIVVYALDPDPDEESVGMAHNLTIEQARDIAATINRLCDVAEAAASDLASAAIAKARGR